MPEPKLVRTMITTRCPHCDKTSVVCLRSFSPVADWNIRMEDLEKSKAKVLERLEAITFLDEKKKQEIVEYLGNPETFIGPDEVEPFLNEIISDNQSQDDTKKD